MEEGAVGTVDKALGLLRLFSPEEPQWTVEAAAQRLGVPTSTAYRYFRSLTEAGLIVDFAAGRYVIGPGIIELDRLARRTDPLIVAAQAPMDSLAAKVPDSCIVLLSRFYRRRVMCVDQRPHGHGRLVLSFERGRPMPLYRGCVSKVILAYLPARAIARIYGEDHAEITRAGMGASLKDFREGLREIRRHGHAVTRSEVDHGVIGIGAPIFSPEGEAFASISLVIPDIADSTAKVPTLSVAVMAAATATTAGLCVLEGPAPGAGRDDSRTSSRSARPAVAGFAIP